jgi:hypothetical protein
MNIEIIPPGFAYGYGYDKTEMQEIAESNRIDVQGLPDGWDKQGIKKNTNKNAGRRGKIKKTI